MQFSDLSRIASCAALAAVLAVGASTTAVAQSAPTAPVNGLPLGQEVADPNAPGTVYIREKSGDWEVRCQRAGEGRIDPCNLYQLLNDDTGNAVAEMTLFAMPAGQQAVAGAQIITPLETLLTEQITISVDGGAAKRYPFAFCTQVGCFSQLGLTADDVASFRRGNVATMRIVPAGAPDGSDVQLGISLTGFTAGFATLQEIMEEAAAARASE